MAADPAAFQMRLIDDIPFVDLHLQHREVADEVLFGFERVIARAAYVLGDEVAAFEEAYARYVGIPHCIGVGNGTDALELALRAAGVGAGHDVILPANTFVATAEAVVRAGALPVLVDCDPEYQLIDVTQVEEHLTPAVRAVIPVHLFGQMAPMEQLLAVAADTEAVVVEDAAQAQGATRHGCHAGSFGVTAGTSFYPGKNLGAYGDGGAVLTASAETARTVRVLRDHGSDAKYRHPLVGMNSRLDTLQAVVLLAKLRRLDTWNSQRRLAAARYAELLSGHERIQLPKTAPGNVHVWHLYAVRVTDRDRVLEGLLAAGIRAGIHYPVTVHLQGAFRSLGYGPGSFPVAERLATRMISLPLFPGITASQQERVTSVLLDAVR